MRPLDGSQINSKISILCFAFLVSFFFPAFSKQVTSHHRTKPVENDEKQVNILSKYSF